jgi:TctA family transporter
VAKMMLVFLNFSVNNIIYCYFMIYLVWIFSEIFFIFVLTQKRNKKVKAVNLFTKNCFIPRKILKTLRAKIFLTLH